MTKSGYKFENYILILIMAVSFILFSLTAFCVFNIKSLSALDISIVASFHNIAAAHSTQIPGFITELGYGFNVTFLMIIFTVIFISFKEYKSALLLNLTTSSAYFLNEFIKFFLHRARPALEYQILSYSGANGYPGFSFPSGHTLVATCFYGTLLFLVFKYVKQTWLKYLSTVILLLLIVLIGLSRIYLGVHHPTDVFASLCLGVFTISFWIFILEKGFNNDKN